MSERFWMRLIRSMVGLTSLALLYVLLFRLGTSASGAISLAFSIFGLIALLILIVNLRFRTSKEVRGVHFTILLILFLALVVRLVAAHTPGHSYDISVNKGWTKSATLLGLSQSYKQQLDGNYELSYPPLSNIIFWANGNLYRTFISRDFDVSLPEYNIVIRFPAIAADLAACVILSLIALRLGLRRVWPLIPLAYALHPAVIYDTSIWGQTDSIYTLWMLLTLYALACDRWSESGIWMACAVLTKPQAIAIVPLALILAFRHLRSMVSFVSGATIVSAIILLPFAIGNALNSIVAVYIKSVGIYFNGMTNGAFNFWTALYGTAGKSDRELLLGLIQYRTLGFCLFGFAALLILWKLRQSLFTPLSRQQHVLGICWGGALLVSAFFLFLTEMHERYHFAYVLLALPVAAMGVPGVLLTAGTGLLIFLNIVALCPFGVIDRALFQEFTALPMLIGSLQVTLFFLSIGYAPRLTRTIGDPSMQDVMSRAS